MHVPSHSWLNSQPPARPCAPSDSSVLATLAITQTACAQPKDSNKVDVNRRALLTGGLALGGAAALGACDRLQVPGGGRVPETSAGASTATMTTPTGMPSTTGNEANDGSWRVTGPQPNQPIPNRLQRGDTPPQFVVVSWDGAG